MQTIKLHNFGQKFPVEAKNSASQEIFKLKIKSWAADKCQWWMRK